jgi:Tfp pilus assembly protein PilX
MKAGRCKSSRRGATLVLVTTIGVIVGILAMSMIELGYHARTMAVRDVEKVKARCAADAGLAEAFERMHAKLVRAHQAHTTFDGAINPVTDATLPGTSATYSYQVNAAGGQYEIVSTGVCNGASKTVHAALGIESYTDGIGLAENLLAQNSATFGVLGTGGPGIKIRSNTNLSNGMWFKNNVRVDGEVWCGPGGNDPYAVIQTVDTMEETVSDGIGQSSELMVWPPVTVPDGLASAPTASTLTTNTSIGPGGFAYYGNLKVANGTTLTVTGSTTIYVEGTLDLDQSGQIVLEPGANLDLYIGGSVITGNSSLISGISSVGPTPIVRIFGLSGPAPTPTCTSINIKTKSSVSVAVYAPEADVRIHNGNSSPDEAFVGALVAKSLTIDNGADFLFDTRFATVLIDDVLAQFVIDRWWED